ncbi:putative skeletal organic matrix protein 5 [Oculina patagonica]
MESRCQSINIGPPINDKVVCELSDSDHSLHPEDLKPRAGFTYTGTENACSSNPCFHDGTCLNGFTDKGYQCACSASYTGKHCETVRFQTCKELYENNVSEGNKAYPLKVGSATVSVYCHLTADLGSCGGGGWTLVMKINGSKSTFHYDSSYWTDENTYEVPAGETGFDQNETKLPTYWNTPFTKICLGIKIPGEETRFLVLNKEASSLHDLISDGQYRPTSLGRDAWKTLVGGDQGSLQLNCNMEGFNAANENIDYAKARIGYIANEQNECIYGDSRIGFGTGGKWDDSNTCGNEACCSSDNGDKHIKAMGYILVQ